MTSSADAWTAAKFRLQERRWVRDGEWVGLADPIQPPVLAVRGEVPELPTRGNSEANEEQRAKEVEGGKLTPAHPFRSSCCSFSSLCISCSASSRTVRLAQPDRSKNRRLGNSCAMRGMSHMAGSSLWEHRSSSRLQALHVCRIWGWSSITATHAAFR